MPSKPKSNKTQNQTIPCGLVDWETLPGQLPKFSDWVNWLK